jgi:nickel transport system ATP-binding protein
LRKIADLRRRAWRSAPGVRQTAGRLLLDGIPVHGEQLRGGTVATIMQNPRSAFNPLYTMATHARETCRATGQPRMMRRLLPP